MLIALLMAPMLERNHYQALNLSHGNLLIFIQRPISATLLSIIVLMSIIAGAKVVRKARRVVQEKEA